MDLRRPASHGSGAVAGLLSLLGVPEFRNPGVPRVLQDSKTPGSGSNGRVAKRKAEVGKFKTAER